MFENKEILTLEFRYFDIWREGKPYKIKKICLGIFNSYEDAISLGNKVLEEVFEKQFNIIIKKDKLSAENKEVSDSVVIPRGSNYKCHFAFYLKIETLEFKDAKETLLEVLNTFSIL